MNKIKISKWFFLSILTAIIIIMMWSVLAMSLNNTTETYECPPTEKSYYILAD